MPYSPSTGVYVLPAVYLAVPGTVIVAVQHNTPLTDLATANNYERPVIAGGTGAATAAGARTNLGVPSSTTTPSYTAPTVDNQAVRWDGVAGALQGSPLVIGDSAVGTATLTATNDGATGAQIITTHVSASPAASDVIQDIIAQGKDSAANTQTYGDIQHIITDPTSASEDSVWAFLTSVAGTLAERLRIGAGLYMQGATGGDPGAGKINATELQVNGAKVSTIVAGVVQATTSGTSKDFTGIPAGTQRITLNIAGLSTNGTSVPIVQLGDSGGIETTGYLGSTATASTNNGANFTTGIALVSGLSAADVMYGTVTMTLLDASTNTWAASVVTGFSGNTASNIGGFSKSTSAVLDRIRLTTVNGTDAFDAGKINILYE